MLSNFKQRTEIIIGKKGIDKLNNAKVIVFGVGGVGGFAVEGLVRAGIGNITVVDFDIVDETNINRQIIALHSTIGMDKVELIKNRALDINPNLKITAYKMLYDETTSDFLLNEDYDFVVDAIDMVKSKLHLIKACNQRGLKIISSMGMGNKLNPALIEIDDISKTEMCPLAKIVRREVRKMGIKKLKVVYSKEKPSTVATMETDKSIKKVNGSTSFVPSSAGLLIASYIVNELIK
ncbi:ThiF family adenylyltransferase [Peptostreptococcus canis]|uniref:tRNA threonylcarbamoyladenosine dehydratase n=1 Tax=Peptostreptococcus canis TaxID=1159213 RepID=A0ABR6TM78_9FIRM|nr:tRNA threonylcarbamoyladenosine dehydratase [Peptostreptococcus canis]MBC2576525.1 tRNA threonylcarbamoyladenosine dehydratase [Peptostreptococcus canis]MBP1998709.1 tRNA A37 threonylcarbamoyladenosine dehydratase [Peptostreptococcus canis]